MAGETDPHSQRAQDGWNSFSRFLGVSTGLVVATLLLMAFFLL